MIWTAGVLKIGNRSAGIFQNEVIPKTMVASAATMIT